MKRGKLIFFIVVMVLGMLLVSVSAFANLMYLDHGMPIVMIDGKYEAQNDSSDNTTVTIAVAEMVIPFMSPYSFGYFLNGDNSTFNDLSGYSYLTFNNGDIVDYAFYNSGNDIYYSLTRDLGDTSYSVVMNFITGVDAIFAEDQDLVAEMGIKEYYKHVVLVWDLPGATGLNISLALGDAYDGQVSVPEPSTLLLLSSGLIGVAFYRRRSKR